MSGEDKKMDTEPGGENTQYESIKTETQPTPKQSGQLGSGMDNTAEGASPKDSDSNSKTAENIRYGQNISESGMGGFTNSTGEAKKEGAYGGAARDEDLEKSKTDARAAQGYGSGSGVGG